MYAVSHILQSVWKRGTGLVISITITAVISNVDSSLNRYQALNL